VHYLSVVSAADNFIFFSKFYL